MTINLSLVVLYAINIWLRASNPGSVSANVSLPVMLSIFGVALLFVSGWLGEQMVHAYGVGVEGREYGRTTSDLFNLVYNHYNPFPAPDLDFARHHTRRNVTEIEQYQTFFARHSFNRSTGLPRLRAASTARFAAYSAGGRRRPYSYCRASPWRSRACVRRSLG